MATKAVGSKPQTSEKNEPKRAVLKNLTNQKQIMEVEGVSYVLNAYSSKEIELTKRTAENKFKFWVEKNIVKIS